MTAETAQIKMLIAQGLAAAHCTDEAAALKTIQVMAQQGFACTLTVSPKRFQITFNRDDECFAGACGETSLPALVMETAGKALTKWRPIDAAAVDKYNWLRGY
jgi:hypothetical protein